MACALAIKSFDRIYFDTSTMLRGGWPSPQSMLTEIFRYVRELGAHIFIPQPAELEVEGAWMRNLYEARGDCKVNAQAQGIVRSEGSPWLELKGDVFSVGAKTPKARYQDIEEMTNTIVGWSRVKEDLAGC